MLTDHELDVKIRHEFVKDNRHSTGCLVKQADNHYDKPHQMCFGGLAAFIMPDSKYIINGFQYGQAKFASLTKDIKTHFLKYLMEDSPWSDCFLEHDAEWSVENNMTYHRIDCPGNMVIGCLSAVREMWEHYSMHGLVHFKKFIEAGCTPDFAWLMCQALSMNDKEFYTTVSAGSGHSSWPGNFVTVETFINYLNHEPKGAFEINFNSAYPYTGVHRLFFSDTNKTLTTNFLDWMLINSNSIVEKANKQMPWEQATTKTARKEIRLLPEDMAKEVAILCNKFYKEFGEWIK